VLFSRLFDTATFGVVYAQIDHQFVVKKYITTHLMCENSCFTTTKLTKNIARSSSEQVRNLRDEFVPPRFITPLGMKSGVCDELGPPQFITRGACPP
jgi:hypothetical protein